MPYNDVIAAKRISLWSNACQVDHNLYNEICVPQYAGADAAYNSLLQIQRYINIVQHSMGILQKEIF